jgi:hypothetical protein
MTSSGSGSQAVGVPPANINITSVEDVSGPSRRRLQQDAKPSPRLRVRGPFSFPKETRAKKIAGAIHWRCGSMMNMGKENMGWIFF